MPEWIDRLEARGYRVEVSTGKASIEPTPPELLAEAMHKANLDAEARMETLAERLVSAVTRIADRPITIQAPVSVDVPAPVVNVSLPEGKAQLPPVVNVQIPDTYTMDIRSMPRTRRTVKRNREGDIEEVIDS